MKIVCPNCKTEYNIDDSSVPSEGLLVKCTVCDTEYNVRKKTDADILSRLQNELDGRSTLDPLADLFSDDNDEVSNEGNAENDLFSDMSDSAAELEQQASSTDDIMGILDDSAPNDNEKTTNFTFDEIVNEAEATTDQSSGTIDEDEFLDDLFQDSSEDTSTSQINLESKLLKESVEKQNEEAPLFASSPQEKDKENIFFKKRTSNEILGPFQENEVEGLLGEGVISEDDFISYDSISWEPISGGESAEVNEDSVIVEEFDFDAGAKSMKESGTRLSMTSKAAEQSHFEEDPFEGEGVPFQEKTQTKIGGGMFTDAPLFDDVSTANNKSSKSSLVDHTFIPEDTFTGRNKDYQKTRGGKRGSSGMFFLKLVLITGFLLVMTGGGYYYYKFHYTPNANVIDDMVNEIATNTGSLMDVREALNSDTVEDYIMSIGILKQYMNSEEVPPAAIGLDAQVKLNLILSYNKRIESMDTLKSRVDASHSENSSNLDLVKAVAYINIVDKEYDDAATLLKPYFEKNDPEVLYILGLAAAGKKNNKNAETFLNAGFIHSSGQSSKIAYALADIKQKSGDTQGAIAFLNKVISSNPYYMKAYLRKGEILIAMRTLDESFSFVKSIKAEVVSKAQDVQKAKYYQMYGEIYRRKGNLAKAIEYYKKTVAIDKNNLESLTKLAKFFELIKNSSHALEYYEKVLKLDSSYAQAILGRAAIFVQLKTFDKAYLEIAKLNTKEMKDPLELFALADIYRQLEEKGKAMALYDKVIKLKPAMVEPYLAKMILLLEDKNLVAIRKIVDKVTKLSKGSYQYFLIKAVLYHEEAEYGKANKFFKKAIAMNTAGDARVHYYYGKLLVDEQKYKQASKHFSKAVKIVPNKFEYRISLAESLLNENRAKEVVAILGKEEFKERRFAKGLVLLSDAYYKLKNYKKSLEKMEDAQKFNSKSSHLYYKKAQVLFSQGEFALAEESIETATMLDLKNFDNYMLYSKILIKREDFKGAIEKIEQAEKLESNHHILFLMKGIVYKNLDNYREALRYFKKIRKNPKLLREASLEIGECYLELNQEKKAMKYLIKAIRQGNGEGYKHLARIYYERGNLNKAAKYYQKSLKYNKKDYIAIKNLGYIFKERKKFTRALTYFRKYLKYVTDDSEKQMVEDEIYFIKKYVPAQKYKKIMEKPEKFDEQGTDVVQASEAKTLYLEGRALRKSDPAAAKVKFQKVMEIVPKTNKYYIKSFKAFKKLK